MTRWIELFDHLKIDKAALLVTNPVRGNSPHCKCHSFANPTFIRAYILKQSWTWKKYTISDAHMGDHYVQNIIFLVLIMKAFASFRDSWRKFQLFSAALSSSKSLVVVPSVHPSETFVKKWHVPTASSEWPFLCDDDDDHHLGRGGTKTGQPSKFLLTSGFH